MARQIIIQRRINIPSDFSFSFVFWASVPSQRQSFYANPTITTSVKDATSGELTALQMGQVVELQATANYIVGTPMGAIQSDLIAKFNTFQVQITNQNPWAFYGTSWDGSTWTIVQTA